MITSQPAGFVLFVFYKQIQGGEVCRLNVVQATTPLTERESNFCLSCSCSGCTSEPLLILESNDLMTNRWELNHALPEVKECHFHYVALSIFTVWLDFSWERHFVFLLIVQFAVSLLLSICVFMIIQVSARILQFYGSPYFIFRSNDKQVALLKQ